VLGLDVDVVVVVNILLSLKCDEGGVIMIFVGTVVV
jgi:hypothetical protein